MEDDEGIQSDGDDIQDNMDVVRVFIVVLLSFDFLMIARVTVKLVMNNADRQTVLFV